MAHWNAIQLRGLRSYKGLDEGTCTQNINNSLYSFTSIHLSDNLRDGVYNIEMLINRFSP
jgi:hypothetical protein